MKANISRNLVTNKLLIAANAPSSHGSCRNKKSLIFRILSQYAFLLFYYNKTIFALSDWQIRRTY